MANISLKSKAQGFSLMELLIVIAIIGALVAIAAASYSSAQKRTRDSRRAADLKAIQNAWEQYYADNSGLYPANCTVSMTTYLPKGYRLILRHQRLIIMQMQLRHAQHQRIVFVRL